MKAFLAETGLLNRAIISDDYDKTLDSIAKRIPLTIHRYKSGTQVFDWVIPKKWVIRDAYIETTAGKRVLDWKKHPLHVIIGSLPVKRQEISKKDLLKRISVNEKYPDSIPYHFKYYELDWGFCMAKKDLKSLKDSKYLIEIDSEYVDGELKVGEHVIEGKSPQSINLIAHIDHSGQVNDGLAGAAVLVKLAEMLKGMKPFFTIRMLFLPETIGSIAHYHHHLDQISQIYGAIFLEMPGTPKLPMVLQHSKARATPIDAIATYALEESGEKFIEAECFKHVVNDDGFLNSPGIDVPCISLSRSKALTPKDWYHFPYYHTSGDSLEHFDFKAAEKYLKYVKRILDIADTNRMVVRTYRGVPNLSRHGLWIDWNLYPKLSQHIDAILFNLDEGATIFDVARRSGVPYDEVVVFLEKMEKKGLVRLEPVV